MLRTQTVNHALSGRFIVAKRDNSHERDTTPKPAYKAEWAVLDSDTLKSTTFTDPLLLAKHLRTIEQQILAEEAKAKEVAYEEAMAKFTDNFQEDIG